MSVLTLLLAGPLQSWGASARFTRRTTEAAPTKSGVIGLLAAAAGIDRADDTRLATLAALRFAVRIDQPGVRIRDFHTAHHGDTGKSMPLTERFYLADAVFVAAVEGPRDVLTGLRAALRDPVYPPFLGRRSCPPAQPVELRLHDKRDLLQALTTEPWQASPWYRRQRREPTATLDVLIEASPGQAGDLQRDQPLSFAPAHRRHTVRTIATTTVNAPHPGAKRHDPFAALQEESD
ncbi:type I-E CRISPR-associated protein Cas5/CasD [Streptomyces sp. NPDC058685]|uniref:type I-E CRISPR-associated protein Cas5/CasD n=1 Tax=Streptomyces sp. NPDC058685 TaxID=3346598 RepID=UPI00364D181E